MTTAKNAAEAKWQELRSGMATVIPTGSSFTMEGQVLTQPELLAKIDTVVSLYTAKAAAELQLSSASAALKGTAVANHALYLSVSAAVRVTLGAKSPQLSQFGLAPQVPRAQQTTQAQALASAKRVATRKLRNPLTKKQKAAIPSVQGLSLQVLGTSASATTVASGTASNTVSLPNAVTTAPAVTAVVTAVTTPATKA